MSHPFRWTFAFVATLLTLIGVVAAGGGWREVCDGNPRLGKRSPWLHMAAEVTYYPVGLTVSARITGWMMDRLPPSERVHRTCDEDWHRIWLTGVTAGTAANSLLWAAIVTGVVVVARRLRDALRTHRPPPPPAADSAPSR